MKVTDLMSIITPLIKELIEKEVQIQINKLKNINNKGQVREVITKSKPISNNNAKNMHNQQSKFDAGIKNSKLLELLQESTPGMDNWNSVNFSTQDVISTSQYNDNNKQQNGNDIVIKNINKDYTQLMELIDEKAKNK